MPREEGPKADRRVGKGTVLDWRAERETVTGLPILNGMEGGEAMEAEDVPKANLRSTYSVGPVVQFCENGFCPVLGIFLPPSAGCQDGVCHVGVGEDAKLSFSGKIVVRI
jgi:hypothetical protein